MTNALIVAGTDTGIGKTLVAAGLTGALAARYWKPVQSGLEEETDSEVVARLTGAETLPEAYRLKLPASPHLSAEAERVAIDPARLALPEVAGPLVVEGAGGLMVPLNRQLLQIDQFADWAAPMVLCARTALGTINHTLLSLEAAKARGIEVLGVIFVGDAEPLVEATIRDFGGVRHLGRLPRLDPVTAETLRSGIGAGIDLAAIRERLGHVAA
ncbi:dethiobiotin synthase [Defluviimonas sp. D31]|uniref:dethiobiotin synthase n=1 Tax=Defluviimonas sp. D31 TaxID=3083253 RepID=UPI00296EB5A8|nr:dethiobiotin synthase [Defluviimonas sp. D31]MDW4549094.1 dethiobiotin synthase [Defluviimonas sp. D31]